MGDGGSRDLEGGKPCVVDDRRVGYPIDTSDQLARLIERYDRTGRSQTVSFRKLVPWLKVSERATHYLHPYPAKLLPQIAHFFLAARDLSPPTAVVLDPFGGTGTVALEALLSGRSALYADVNPLARLIASTKTTAIARPVIEATLASLRKRFFAIRGAPIPSVVNVEYWFDEVTIRSLAMLRRALDEVSEDSVRALMYISFSVVTKKLSNADPRLSVPVRLKGKTTIATKKDVWRVFEGQVSSNIKRMEALQAMMPMLSPAVHCVGSDARALVDPKGTPLSPDSVDLIITSPPYAGAQKYIRASSINLGWLGLAQSSELVGLERKSIGREHFRKDELAVFPETSVSAANKVIRSVWSVDRVRAKICSTYINEMEVVVKELTRVLKPGGSFVLVIGNNEVCGVPFKSSDYLRKICEGHGLRTRLRLVDEIRSRGLMTKRNRSAGIISREWVILFEKSIA